MRRPLRIGLIGLGVVGAEVARLLLVEQKTLSAQAGRPLEIVAYSTRDPHKQRGVDLSKLPWVASPAELAAREDIDILVELMGGADGPALEAAEVALKARKHLVTANKAMLAKHWAHLFALSKKHHAAIMFEASVCAGIPVVKVLREGLAGNRISRISGILNGTCNYILSAMAERGIEFADALKEAQNLGYAEADPTLDIDGWDTAHKLIVLAKLGFDPAITLEQIPVKGIRDITLADVQAAKVAGKAIRLVASAEKKADGTYAMEVAPKVLDAAHPLAPVSGPMNAITIDAQPVQSCTLIGPGAGAGPTASAVLADIIDLARFDILLEGPLYLPR
ncbi:MAG: homoserine dehydrogenase [Alphaproteobacteria bacterium]|nr:homoserine dehydrogenase [Alphaproteobacteria bacterium]